MATGARSDYRLSFSTGGLLVNESVDVARLRSGSESWDAVVARAVAAGATSQPKAASRRRTVREIVNRLSTLSEPELSLLVETDDRNELRALLWTASCRAYRFVGEFAAEVVQERYLSYDPRLDPDVFDRFWEEKAQWSPELQRVGASTQRKLRQVLFRMMREAGLLSTGDEVQPAYLSTRLRDLLLRGRPSDLAVFPGALSERM